MTKLSRRDWLTALGGSLTASAMVGGPRPVQGASPEADDMNDEPFGYGLNTSTIRGQELTLPEVVALASEVGYQGLEPWIRELDAYVEAGGSLPDLGKQIQDARLSVESVIGFFEWAVDDDAQRRAALEEARRNMEMLQQIGGKRIAAPPVGLTDRTDVDLLRVAERYRELLELGDAMGVVPQVEVWGFSTTLNRLGEAALVAIESGHPSACILPDVYHIYKGGSSFEGLKLLGSRSIHVFHMNDYPADPPRAEITDADRVYPGHGVAPLTELLRDLRAIGFRGMLSLELFNRDYWAQDARTVALTGLETMRAAVRRSLA